MPTCCPPYRRRGFRGNLKTLVDEIDEHSCCGPSPCSPIPCDPCHHRTSCCNTQCENPPQCYESTNSPCSPPFMQDYCSPFSQDCDPIPGSPSCPPRYRSCEPCHSPCPPRFRSCDPCSPACPPSYRSRDPCSTPCRPCDPCPPPCHPCEPSPSPCPQPCRSCDPCPPPCRPCDPRSPPCPPRFQYCDPCPPSYPYCDPYQPRHRYRDPCPPRYGYCNPCPPRISACTSLVREVKSRELVNGELYSVCLCDRRNGLQDDCPRTECHGRPECLTLPYPMCAPSRLVDAIRVY